VTSVHVAEVLFPLPLFLFLSSLLSPAASLRYQNAQHLYSRNARNNYVRGSNAANNHRTTKSLSLDEEDVVQGQPATSVGGRSSPHLRHPPTSPSWLLNMFCADFGTFILALTPPSLSIYPPNVWCCTVQTHKVFSPSITELTMSDVEGILPNQAQMSSPMVWGWHLCTWLWCPQATDHGRGQSRLAPWLASNMSNNLFARGWLGPGTILRRIL
jgi:hypothetical protein